MHYRKRIQVKVILTVMKNAAKVDAKKAQKKFWGFNGIWTLEHMTALVTS